MNLPGKVQHQKLKGVDDAEHHPYINHSSHPSFVSDIIGNSGDHNETTSTSTSAADTLSMLTQSMLGTMPSAVATAAAAGLFMRVSGGGSSGPDGGSPG